ASAWALRAWSDRARQNSGRSGVAARIGKASLSDKGGFRFDVERFDVENVLVVTAGLSG
ncbi:MAG: hypothetical protein ACD_10C00637G0001, partial [uncultured bacterium]